MALSRTFVPKECNCSRVFASVGRENLTDVFTGGAAGVATQYPLGGIWYSHPAAGECKGVERIGHGSSSCAQQQCVPGSQAWDEALGRDQV